MSREEAHVVSALVDLCRARGVTCVVQVGAQDGWEAHRIAEGTGARAVAIEGDSRNQSFEGSKAEYHYAVIGPMNGMSLFYRNVATAELSSTLPRPETPQEAVFTEIQRLDSFCERNNVVPDALIVDTEGTTLDVLISAGKLLDGLKVVYAECQSSEIRPGIRLVNEVDAMLAVHGFTQHTASPSYCGGAQSNYTWVR